MIALQSFRNGLDKLNARKQDKDTELRLSRDAETFMKLVAEHGRLDGILKDARTADSERRRCVSERDAIRVTDEAVSELKKIERARDLAKERLSAAATRIVHRLQSGAVVRLGDQSLAGDGSVLLTQRTELEVEGVGHFVVIPGGEDLDVLRRKVEGEDQRTAEALSEIDAENVAHAEANLHQKNELDGQAARHAAILKGLAPEGLQALEDQVSSVGAQRDSLQQKLGDNADREFDIGGLGGRGPVAPRPGCRD